MSVHVENGKIFIDGGDSGFDYKNFCSYDIDGNKLERTKQSHPYSYDPFTIWRVLPKESETGSFYTDRMYQWDYELTTELVKKHFNTQSQYFDKYTAEQLEPFVRERFNKPNLKVVALREYCNAATGYPVWLITYSEPKPEN